MTIEPTLKSLLLNAQPLPVTLSPLQLLQAQLRSALTMPLSRRRYMTVSNKENNQALMPSRYPSGIGALCPAVTKCRILDKRGGLKFALCFLSSPCRLLNIRRRDVVIFLRSLRRFQRRNPRAV